MRASPLRLFWFWNCFNNLKSIKHSNINLKMISLNTKATYWIYCSLALSHRCVLQQIPVLCRHTLAWFTAKHYQTYLMGIRTNTQELFTLPIYPGTKMIITMIIMRIMIIIIIIIIVYFPINHIGYQLYIYNTTIIRCISNTNKWM